MTLALGADDVAALLGGVDAVAAVEAIHRDLGDGAMSQPAPVALTGGDDAILLPMAARSDRLGLAAVKLMADIPDNAHRGLPSQRSTILVSSTVTGECVAVIDGGLVTRVRTAAASVVATRHLARPTSRALGLVGAGNLAIEHALSFERDARHRNASTFERIVVWSRSSSTVRAFIEGVGPELAARCTVVASARDVAEQVDVLCTLTPSVEPVVVGSWLHAGQHVNAVGARPRPTHRELDGEAMARATVVVDSRPTAFAKSGDLLEAIAEGALAADARPVELGEVIAGVSPGRGLDDEITVFDSTGIAAQDLALAAELIAVAQDRGVGTPITLSRIPSVVGP